jgi:hypothetical protein
MEKTQPIFEHLNVRIDYSRLPYDDLHIAKKDRDILRGLASRVAEIARKPVQQEKRKLWTAHNRLVETRPPIFCDPENGWNEIIPAKDIRCGNDIARHWEGTLRKEQFWGEKLVDDRVIEARFDIPHVYTQSGWGVDALLSRLGEVRSGTSYRWEGGLKDYTDIGTLRFRTITVDEDLSSRVLSLAREIMGDILDVRPKTVWWWSVGLTDDLAMLRGFNQTLLDFHDNPDGVHALMSFLRDGTMAMLDHLERNGLLFPNNDGTFVGSGGYGWSDELAPSGARGGVLLSDMWGMGESQITTGISPQMFEEFVLRYQLPLLERFGLNCYGCCEPLDQRWRAVEKIPRLRRVSVSPWADVDEMAEHLGNRYIFSYKPPPMDLAGPTIDEDAIRKRLDDVVRKTKGCRLEICMKDTHTLGGNPQNLVSWCRLAREASENG